MATVKQRKAVQVLVGNGGNVTDAMRQADYSLNTYNTPQKLTESKGYKEVLEEYGLTEELVTTALVEDIKAKPKKRFLELSLGAELLQMKKQPMPTQINIIGGVEIKVRRDNIKN